ncbi:MAG: hypothetical protein KME13_23330 [Myxacorys californica WJT36-NPBG1]|jgi:hypothetical protein|nr:hypothetical protein [Myxacorys californica WJT36-NPBG1]
MTHNTSRIISELEELDIAIRTLIHAYRHMNECTEEQLEKTLARINTITILYGNIFTQLAEVEQQSLRDLKLRKLLIPAEFEGAWYVTRSHPQTEDRGTDLQFVPNR